MTTRTVQSGSYPQAVRILSDKVLTATDIHTVSQPANENETATMYEYTQTEFTKDEYFAYLAEKERSDIDYIAMMSDIELEE